MTCPKCQAALSSEPYESLEVDRCPKCSGVWLDEGELLLILQNTKMPISESLASLVLSQAKAGIPNLELSSVEACPKCDANLNPLNYNYASGIIIDVCPNRHGIWFDFEELEKVKAHFEIWQAKIEDDGQTWGVLTSAMDKNSQKMHEERLARGKERAGGMFHRLFGSLEKIMSSD